MTRSARRSSTLAVLLAAALVATVAQAAVYAPIGDASLVGRAPAAALVRAVASEPGTLASGLPETRTRFEVIEALRGGLGREVEVGVLGGETADGRMLVVPDVPRFEPGRVYLLLLSQRPDGRYGVVEQSLGAFDVVQDEAGVRWATRLSFSEKKARTVEVLGEDGRIRAELEPMRRLNAFSAAIRDAQGLLMDEPGQYVGAASGRTIPVRESRGVSTLWDSNWSGQRARWSPSATATTYACDVQNVTWGQGGVADGGYSQLAQAATEWSTVPFAAKGAVIHYNVPIRLEGTCPTTPEVNSGQVVIALDDTAMTGAALACGEGGVLGMGAWLTDNTSHTWKDESYKTIKAGQAWLRRVDCSVYPENLFNAVVLHVLGNTLGLSNSNVSQNANDVDPTDNLGGVMVATFGPVPPSGLNSDDIDGAAWLYTPTPVTPEGLQAAFYFPNPWYKGEAVPFSDRSRGTPTTWSWTFGDGSPAATTPNPTHTYAAAGLYTVSLTVTRTVAGVVETSTTSQTISILTDIVPVLTTTPPTVQVGSPVTVGLSLAKGKGKSPAQLDFDDGTAAAPTTTDGVTYASTVHTYTEPGKYYVRATVQDQDNAIAPGVTGPENFATAIAVVTVYPVACTAPTVAPVVNLPDTVRLGNNLFISWTADPNLDPRIDEYQVDVSAIPEFPAGSVETFRTASDYLLYRVVSYPVSTRLYVRVRTVKQCATTLVSPNSNVASSIVVRPPTVVVAVTSPGAMFHQLGSSAAAPTAEYCFLNQEYSIGDALLALSLTGTDAGAFTLDKTSVTILPGEIGCVKVTPKPATLAAAGNKAARLVASWGSAPEETIDVEVSLLVSSSSRPPASTVMRAAASKLNFAAPAGQTPTPVTLTVNITPPPQSGQTIELQVLSKPAWLVVDQPAGGLKFDAAGQIVLTIRVDRTLRDYPGAPQSGDLGLGLAFSNPAVTISIPVLDMEPYTVQSGQAGTRSVQFEPLGKLDTLDESPGSFFVASAVEAPGLQGAFFSSDGWLRNNTNVDDLPLEFWYTPAGKDGTTDTGVLVARTAVKANRTLRLSSFLTTVFGLTGGSGMVEVKSRFAGAFTFRSRTQSSTGGDPALLFGAEMPSVAVTDGVDASGGEATVPGIVSTNAGRSNLILANVTREGATVEVKVTGADGTASGTISNLYVPPFSRQQIDGVASAAGFPSLSLGSLSMKVTAGSGRVVPVVSVVDNASNSFSLVKGRKVGTGSFRALIVPGVVRATGANDTRYRTSLNIANGTAAPANLQLVYRYYDLDLAGKPGEAVVNVTIPAFGSLPAAQADDVLSALFGLDGQTYGWIAIEGEAQKVAAAAVVAAQVDNANAAKGRTAAQLAAIPSTSREITSLGAQPIRFAGAEKSTVRRSNLVILETAGAATTVQVVLTNLSGTVLGVKDLELKAYEYRQVNDLFGPALFDLGGGPFAESDISVQVKSGSGRVLSFVSTIVNASRNPEIYLLAPSGP